MNTLIIFGAKYLIYIIVLIMLIFIFFQNKKEKKNIIFFSLFVMPISYIMAKICSFIFYNPRPFVIEKTTPLVDHIADNGFPSDHTLLAGAIAIIVFFSNKKIGFFLFILAGIVGICRVFAKVHHIEDIIASFIIVIFVSYIFQKVFLNKNL